MDYIIQMQEIFEGHPFAATLVAASMVAVWRFAGFYTWYVLIVAALLIAGTTSGAGLYAWAFFLGMLASGAEIIGKFNDEPVKALRTPHAVMYVMLNGAFSMFGLNLLLLYGFATTTDLDKCKIVLSAGIGSMALLRSKLLTLKVDNEDVALGPDQLVKVFLRFMEQAIDRVRAQTRIDVVKTKLTNIDFDAVKEYSITMLSSFQTLEKKDHIIAEIEKVANEEGVDVQLKSYALGFILLDEMGEDFVIKLFENPPREWRLRAPLPVAEKSIMAAVFGRKPKFVMIYGPSLSKSAMREKLGWTSTEDAKFFDLTKPQKCMLKDYRLVFNKPIVGEQLGHKYGLSNIVEDANTAVEGVLYQLQDEAINFLDRAFEGYVRKQVTVTCGGKEAPADVYVATATEDGLKPARGDLRMILEGAEEFHLGLDYIRSLRAMMQKEAA